MPDDLCYVRLRFSSYIGKQNLLAKVSILLYPETYDQVEDITAGAAIL